MIASSSAITTRRAVGRWVLLTKAASSVGITGERMWSSPSAGGVGFAGHLVEEPVLLQLEFGDRTLQAAPVVGHGVGVTARLARVGVRQRRLRHQRTQARLLGLLFEEAELLERDRAFGPQPLEPLAHVDETPLDHGLRHGTNSIRRPVAA